MSALTVLTGYIDALGTRIGAQIKQTKDYVAYYHTPAQVDAAFNALKVEVMGGSVPVNADSIFELSTLIAQSGSALTGVTQSLDGCVSYNPQTLTAVQQSAVKNAIGIVDLDLAEIANYNPTATLIAAML